MAKYEEWLTKEGLLKIEGWARDGLTDEQISANIGISRITLYEWKKKYDVFAETLKQGKEVVDREVENALFKSALGYEYEEVTKEPNEVGELVVTKIVKKQATPNTTAQIFWLKNRKPREWRDKQEIEHSGETTQNVVQQQDLSKYSVEELKQLANILNKPTDT